MNKLLQEKAEQRRIYRKRWYDEHRKQVLAGHKKAYERNKEQAKEYSRRYRREHREACLVTQKEYREKHREELNKRTREWYEKNKEYAKEYARQHRQGAKERRKIEHKRVVEFFGGKCVICGSQKNLHFHEKSGKEHSYNDTWKLALEFPERFVLLCRKDHGALHGMVRLMERANEQGKRTVLKGLLRDLM